MEKIIKTKFGDLKNPQPEKERINYTVPLTGENHFQAVSDPEMTSIVAQVVIKHKGNDLSTASDYSDAIVNQLFNSMLGARYSELLRQAEPPYLHGEASIGDFLGGVDCFYRQRIS